MIQCVIFDCDGTLVDSEYLCNLALEKMLARYAVVESAESLMHSYKGWKLKTIFEALSKKHAFSITSSFEPEYRKLVAHLFEEKLEPVPFMHEALEAIPVKVCVASSGPQKKIRHSLSLTGLGGYFPDNVFSAYDIDSWKPEPDLFLHAAKEMSVSPEHCAVVEDSKVGIEAAQRAGMKAFLYDPHDEFLDQSPDVTVFKTMLELPSLLGF